MIVDDIPVARRSKPPKLPRSGLSALIRLSSLVLPLSLHGDVILDEKLEVKSIPEAPLSHSTFVTIKTEPRL